MWIIAFIEVTHDFLKPSPFWICARLINALQMRVRNPNIYLSLMWHSCCSSRSLRSSGEARDLYQGDSTTKRQTLGVSSTFLGVYLARRFNPNQEEYLARCRRLLEQQMLAEFAIYIYLSKSPSISHACNTVGELTFSLRLMEEGLTWTRHQRSDSTK